MEITRESAEWIRFLLHRVATKGCIGIKCRKCILRYRCLTRKPEDSPAVAIQAIREMTTRVQGEQK